MKITWLNMYEHLGQDGPEQTLNKCYPLMAGKKGKDQILKKPGCHLILWMSDFQAESGSSKEAG